MLELCDDFHTTCRSAATIVLNEFAQNRSAEQQCRLLKNRVCDSSNIFSNHPVLFVDEITWKDLQLIPGDVMHMVFHFKFLLMVKK